MDSLAKKAERVFRRRSGTLRTVEALQAGIHPRTLYRMRDSGSIEQIARGLFRLTKLPEAADPDLLTIAKLIPRGVFCLTTALSIHGLTTQIPHAISIALPRTARHPQLEHPPLEVFRFSAASFNAGIQSHDIDGYQGRIYTQEKTLADTFKFRNKIGMDVALEALRRYSSRKDRNFDMVLHFAGICRVEALMRPYLEAIQ